MGRDFRRAGGRRNAIPWPCTAPDCAWRFTLRIDLGRACNDYGFADESPEGHLIQYLNNRLGKGVTALAVMLIAVLVVQMPVALVDRALHALDQAHSANAFAGPLTVHPGDHDHDQAHDRQLAQDHHDDDASDVTLLAVDDDRDPSPSHGTHHHHDGPSLLGLVTAVAAASPWIASAEPWPGRDTSLASAEPSPQKRPPKASLEHVA